MNVRRIRELADVIEEHPEWFRMEYWAFGRDGSLISDTSAIASELDHCGTSGCIAGLAVWMFSRTRGARTGWRGVIDAAVKLLGLTDGSASILFLSNKWPYPYCERFNDADTQSAKAAVAVRLLRDLADGKVAL